MLRLMNGSGSLATLATFLLWAALPVCGQSPSAAIHNPHNVSYCVMGNLIEEYENAEVPRDLAEQFDGYDVSVGVAFEKPGQIVCGYQPSVRKPKEAGIELPKETLSKISAPLCASIRKWKFRPFFYNGKPAPVLGPVVVHIQNRKFTLVTLTPPCQTNARPIERR